MVSKSVMNGGNKLGCVLLGLSGVATSAWVMLVKAITHARIDSNKQGRHVRGNAPWFLDILATAGC